jgi:hypothetical protein
MTEYPKAHPLDFETIREDFDTVVRSVIYKVERECPVSFSSITGARDYLLISLLRSENLYKTIRFVCADSPPDPARRGIYMLSIPVLTRAILDSTFNLLYLFEEPKGRFEWFNKAGWKEQQRAYEQLNATYACYSNWSDYLQALKVLLDRGEDIFGISLGERTGVERIDRWPTPGKMPTFRIKTGGATPTLKFLSYLNDWFYRELSQDTHLSAFGAIKTGAILLNSLDPVTFDRKIDWDKIRGVFVGRSLVVVLSLFSEVDAFFKFGRKEKLRYVWNYLAEHGPETKEVYEERYRALLQY